MAFKTWTATSSGNWNTAADWNSGVPGAADDAIIQAGAVLPYMVTLNGPIAVHSVTLNDAKATLAIKPSGSTNLTTGTIDLIAGTLEVDNVTQLTNATILMDGGAVDFQFGTFSNVTIRGTLTLASGKGMQIVNHLSMTSLDGLGRGTLIMAGAPSSLIVTDDEVISNLDIIYTTPSSNATVGEGNNGHTLTLAADTTVTVTGGVTANLGSSGTLVSAGVANINNGTMVALGSNFTNAGVINVASGQMLYDFATQFNNVGTIASNAGTVLVHSNNFGGGGSLSLTNATLQIIQAKVDLTGLGTISGTNSTLGSTFGTFDLDGQAMNFGAGAVFNNLLFSSGTLHGGTVVSVGGLTWNGGGILDGITWNGVVDLGINSTMGLLNGVTFHAANGTGSASVTLDHFGSAFQVMDNETLSNLTVNMGLAGNDTLFEGQFNANTVTLAASVTINSVGDATSRNFIQSFGSLANQGTLNATSGNVVVLQHFTNANGGLINANGGKVFFTNAALSNLSSGTLTGGTWFSGANSTIEFANNAVITTDSADITLSSATANFEWLNTATAKETQLGTTLSSITAGHALHLTSGAVFTSGTLLTVDGLLQMNAATFTTLNPAAVLTIDPTGTLQGNGTVISGGSNSAVLNDSGLIEASGGTLSLSGAITGTGVMQIDAGATLRLNNSSAATDTIAFAGANATLALKVPATVQSTLANFSPGNTIDLLSMPLATVTSATINGSVLTVTTTNSSPLTFNVTGNTVSGALKVISDGAVGTDILALNAAMAQIGTPGGLGTVDVGNFHVGDPLGWQGVSITNVAPTGGENLDASIVTGSPGIVAAQGQVNLLAPSQTDSSSLQVAVTTGSAELKQGTATLNLISDGSGIDNFGQTPLPSQSIAVQGTVWSYAAPTVLLGATGTLDFGAAQVGDPTLSHVLPLYNGIVGQNYDPYREALVYQVAAMPASPSFDITNTPGTIIDQNFGYPVVDLSTAVAGNFAGNSVGLGFTSTGVGTSGLAGTQLPGQNVALAGRVYASAVPLVGAFAPIIAHVGDVGATGSLNIGNVASGALTDSLAIGFDFTSAPFSLGSSPAPIQAGQTGVLSIGMEATNEGAKSGSLTLWLDSTDPELNDITVAFDSIALTGTVYGYGFGVFNSGNVFNNSNTLDFGVHRVGDVIAAKSLSLSDTSPGASDPFRESLHYTLSGAPAGVNFTGPSSGTLAVGQSDNFTASIANNAPISFDFQSITVNEQSIALPGSGFSGVTQTSTDHIYFLGTVYQTAIAQINTPTVDFGILHVGDVVNSTKTVSITNGATPNNANLNLNDRLAGSFGDVISGYGLHPGIWGSLPTGFTSTGQLLGTFAGDTDALQVQIDTSAAAIYDVNGSVAFSSWDAQLADLTLPSQSVELKGQVLNYATAAAVLVNAGALQLGTIDATHYTLDLGTLTQGATPFTFGLEAMNAAHGPADSLAGFIGVATQTTLGFGYQESAPVNFSNVGAQQTSGVDTISVDLNATGQISADFAILSEGTNSSGYFGPSSIVHINVTGTIGGAPMGGAKFQVGPNSKLNGGDGNNSFSVAGGVLNWADQLNGGGGFNVLTLQGGGYFDVSAPAVLNDIQLINVTEGLQSAGTFQTVTLRAGTKQTVIVGADTLNPRAPAQSGIYLITNNNADTIDLGNGNDVVYLQGGAAQTINAGGADGFGTGNATIYVNASTLPTHINGAAHGNTHLILNGAGRMTLGGNFNHINSIALSQNPGAGPIDLSMGGLKNVQVTADYTGGDTIRLDDVSQSVVGGLDTHVIAAAATAGGLYVGAAPASGPPRATLLIEGGGNAVLNVGDNNIEVDLQQASNLTLSKQSNIVAVGSSGNDTIVALTSGQVLTGGAGMDFLAVSSVHGDIFRDTLADMQMDTLAGFGRGDQLDITDIRPDLLALHFAQMPGVAPSGVLSITDATGRGASINLLGSYNAAPQSWSIGSDGHGGATIGYLGR